MLGVVIALVLAAVGVVGYYAKSAVDAMDNIRREPSIMPTGRRPTPVQPSEAKAAPLNFVLMGSDHRGTERGRSDVLQLLHISGDRKQVFLMSIPRDSWVPIPGHSDAKINAAYSWGGAALAVETLESLLDVPMDHTAIIDFEGFVNVIDALGGVTVNNREASTAGDLQFPKGEITLDGNEALIYVRQRKNLSDGDFGRATRQRDVIKAVVEKLTSTGVLTDPARFREAVTTLGSNFTVDEALTNQAILDLGWSMRDVRGADIHSFQIPTSGFGTSADGQSIVLLDKAALADLQTALRTDTMLGFYESHR
ncbi:transcriptional attenuator, LytR family [Tessaracoccus bendigoensis DSM 12906]|uniref:Transcriptional attenuator, LytR family n=1 Tax=Tessaracoccus bendigoensis DSM 12906 TaxID=1123357 RepID=A0A1M6J2J5_9ACTN|nr:transcriptional attenuator, LytR family [Tessaracoccus bendigoensis DSM 12906]